MIRGLNMSIIVLLFTEAKLSFSYMVEVMSD